MRQLFVIGLILFLSSILWARTSSYFALTGDRVMINIQSGNPYSPSTDDDAIRLYQAMKVSPENSIMGKGKKIEVSGALTLIVAERGQGQYDGSIMIQNGPGVTIDTSKKRVAINLQGAQAEDLAKQFNLTNGIYDFVSEDSKLQLFVNDELFSISYSEQRGNE
ncbi:MAG: hypothetical protein RJB66_1494 [Pseudomonadota bacterium]|jgi:hypothetical protein